MTVFFEEYSLFCGGTAKETSLEWFGKPKNKEKQMKRLTTFMAMAVLLAACGTLIADDAGLQAELQALKNRVAELETQQQMTAEERNADLLEQLVKEMDARPRAAADTTLTAGYDKRFFIKSADDQFLLEFDTRFQFRHTYGLTDDCERKLDNEGRPVSDGVDSSANGFELERAKLILKGHVLKDVNYRIQIEMDDEAGEGDNAWLQEYEVSYSFMPELGVRVGRYKSAFGKQENTSSGRLMMVDRSLANEVFNISRGTGIEIFGACPIGDTKLHHRIGIFNGFRDEQNNPLMGNDNNPAVAARVVVPLMGATPADFVNESDLSYHENPVAQVGVNFAYANIKTEDHYAVGSDTSYTVLVKNNDGLSDTVTPGGEITMFGADVAYKCNGLSLILEGFYQHADLDGDATFDDSFGSARDALGIAGMAYDNYGWTAQAGYFMVPNTFELVSRIGGVCVEDTNNSYEYAAGWNWYLSGQDLKISMDVTYIDDLPIISSTPNFVGVQNNSLFMIRSQLQFQF
jgi:hypothetical protein